MDPLIKGLLWFITGMVITILAGLVIFDEDGKVSTRSLKTSLWNSRKVLPLFGLVALALKIENTLQDIYAPGFRVTEWVYQFEGVSHIVWLQENLDYYLLIHGSSIFYVLGLSFFLTLAPIFFWLRRELDILEDFSKALVINYIFLISGYLSIHLVVTSHYAPEVTALLYNQPQYNAVIQLTNRQVNCMPSGHISLPTTITLFAMYRAKLKRLSIFGIVFTIFTAFVIIFLGVHWLIDIPAGLAVALTAYWVSTKGKLDPIFDKITGTFEKYTEILIKRYV